MENLHRLPRNPEAPATDRFQGTPYRMLRRLASGATGEVFVVEHRQLGTEFVAKLLHPKLLIDPQVVDRVRVEAQSLGKLYHPNIVAVLGYGLTPDNCPYLVTEYLRGRTLTQELAATGPLPPLDALVYTCQVLWALTAAHAIGIIHRDIKPDNLFLVEQPNAPPLLKVLDFGIARVVPGISPQAPLPLAVPTDTGVVLGTPRYMSPEVALGSHADPRSDIYGVGMVLYQMLTGRCPFDHAKDNTWMLVAHITEQPKPPSHYASSNILPDLDAAVLKALQTNPEDRYQSAKEFEATLSAITDDFLNSHYVADTADAAPLPASPLKEGDTAPTDCTGSDTTQPLPLVHASSRVQRATWSNYRTILLFVLVALATAIIVAQIGLHGGLGAR